MKYVIGENGNLSYFIANHAVTIQNMNATFFVGNVAGGHVGCTGWMTGPMLVSHSSGGFTCGSFNGAIRPIVIIPSNIQMEKNSSGIYEI